MIRLRAALAFALLLVAAPVLAHLMPAQQGTIHLKGDVAYVVVSLPVSALGGDDDGDGLLSVAELQRHMPQLRDRVTRGLRLRDGESLARPAMLQVMSDAQMQAGERVTHVVVMAMFRFAAPPSHPVVETDLFGTRADEQRLALRARRDSEIEPVVLTPLRPAHALFQPAWRSAADYVLLGAEHILLGVDHLLFLLTVLVMGAGWRYWITVITSFTAAHSVTLAMAMLGWVRLPASVAEPMIAGSIVLVAWDNLRRDDAKLATRCAIVFACGLVHGLGFARALEDLGGTEALWLRLAGFNLGVELGQLVFVAAALVTMASLRRLVPALTAPRLARATSWTAAGLGGVLLAQLLV